MRAADLNRTGRVRVPATLAAMHARTTATERERERLLDELRSVHRVARDRLGGACCGPTSDERLALVSELDAAWVERLASHVPDDAPVGIDGLTRVDVRHRLPDGTDAWGTLIVPRHGSASVLASRGIAEHHAGHVQAADDRHDLAEDLAALFRDGYRDGSLVVELVAPWQLFEPLATASGRSVDQVAMSFNATSSFQARSIAGTDRWSRHAVGAIDLNPLQNPALVPTVAGVDPRRATARDLTRGRLRVEPPEGRPFALHRPETDPRVLRSESFAVRFLRARGWSWGGDWTTLLDPQHLSYGVE